MATSAAFTYLAERIDAAEVLGDPFPHIYVRDLFDADHFDRIVNDSQVHFGPSRTNVGVLAKARRAGFRPQEFPGCTTNRLEYLTKLHRGDWGRLDSPVEGFGMALRLKRPRSRWLTELLDYMNGGDFLSAIERKFDLGGGVQVETAIQKYLSGYEISPHPDIRRKSATYMVNINDPQHPFPADLHTHLLRFKAEYEWIYDYWAEGTVDRCWVPWDWCETRSMTVDNNAMVMFAPSDRSLHAVKLRYDHRAFQRTQIYGNLWSTASPPVPRSTHLDLLRVASARE